MFSPLVSFSFYITLRKDLLKNLTVEKIFIKKHHIITTLQFCYDQYNSLWHSCLCFSKILLGMVNMEFRIPRTKNQTNQHYYMTKKKVKKKSQMHILAEEAPTEIEKLVGKTSPLFSSFQQLFRVEFCGSPKNSK